MQFLQSPLDASFVCIEVNGKSHILSPDIQSLETSPLFQQLCRVKGLRLLKVSDLISEPVVFVLEVVLTVIAQ